MIKRSFTSTIMAKSVRPLIRIYQRFPCSPFLMLIHTKLAQAPLLRATLSSGRGNSFLSQRDWDYDSIAHWTKVSF